MWPHVCVNVWKVTGLHTHIFIHLMSIFTLNGEEKLKTNGNYCINVCKPEKRTTTKHL